jgi:signal transduction histidine kinase
MQNPMYRALLPEITHGDHCCLIFSSPQDQTEATVPFLAIGLERNERSVYVGDRDCVERIHEGLKRAGIDVEDETRKGRLVLSSEREYLERETFNTDKMLSFLQQTYDATLARGYSALRAAGDMSWEVGPRNDFRDIVYYETLLDLFFLGKKMVGMCQYPKQKCPPEVWEGILTTHKIAALDREICSNVHYVPAELLVEKDTQVRQQKRMEWMTSQLLRARKAEDEILRLNADLERRVAERTAELKAAFRGMESFAYSVSHDLRAPLRAIDGFSQALLEDSTQEMKEEGRRYLKKISESARRMGQLIEDLLRFSKVSRAAFTGERVDMTALTKTAAQECGAPATIAELPTANGDPSLLRQVLTNLLSNAVKFTRDKSDAWISVGATAGKEFNTYYVQDNGAGFDMNYADKLFDVFQRLHRLDEFEGTGIGLAIVRQIIQKHGGRTWAEGKPGEGATFYFTLPAWKDEQVQRPNC